MNLRAYVIGPASGDLDLFYTLPTSLGLDWSFEHARLERDRFTLELLPDVDRDHAIHNAILVVVPSAPIGYLRLALVHAWREGVRRFILLFADRQMPTSTGELEHELRVILDALGDGGAAPVVRSPLTRCAGRTSNEMRTSMLELLAEVERVFVPDAVMVEAAPSPMFAREHAVLDAIRPLVRSASMLEKLASTLPETAALHEGTGGSNSGGWPYLPAHEPWPTCPTCKQPAPCFLQLDMRDALHTPPPAHHLFVLYRCRACGSSDNIVVRHYDQTSMLGRWPIEPTLDHHNPELLVATRLAHCLPDSEIVDADVIAKLQAIDPEWQRLYGWAETCMGMGALRIPDHLGGWQTAQTPSIPTCACDEPLTLVASLEWGDWWHHVWACPIHPELALVQFQK